MKLINKVLLHELLFAFIMLAPMVHFAKFFKFIMVKKKVYNTSSIIFIQFILDNH